MALKNDAQRFFKFQYAVALITLIVISLIGSGLHDTRSDDQWQFLGPNIQLNKNDLTSNASLTSVLSAADDHILEKIEKRPMNIPNELLQFEKFLNGSYYLWRRKIKIPDIEDGPASKLSERFPQRKLLLDEGCHQLEASGDALTHDWSWQLIHKRMPEDNTLALNMKGTHGVCLIPKAGSTSWKNYIKKLLNGKRRYFQSWMHKPPNDDDIVILTTRHPLDRLKSAYTDKFLGGAPISKYTTKYIKKTSSAESWEVRWNSYWLPVLISSGKVEVTEDFKKAMSDLKNTTSFNKRFRYAVEEAYNSQIHTLKRQYKHATFSFIEFLKHVLWTKKIGLGDHHWVPQSEFCNVCNKNFKYIMKLESINEEMPYLLNTMNYTDIPKFKSAHSSFEKFVKKSSYIEYFKEVPLDILNSLLELYKYDFLLFGYSM